MESEMNMEHEYWLEIGEKPVAVLVRKTKPKIGRIISYNKARWMVWYVEENSDHHRARLEPYSHIAFPPQAG